MASASGGATTWRITGEDRAKHDSQFYQLKPVNGFITGEQAKTFFMQSGLPTPVLGQIWSLADFNNDGKMDRKEFSIAMYLIKKKLQGFELPKSLPAGLKSDPSPVMGSFGTMPSAGMPMSAAPLMGSQSMGAAPMNMGMPVMGMAPTSMTASSLAMPIMANGVAPAMGQTNFMGAPPSMASGTAMMDTKPRTGSFTAPMPPPGASPAGNFVMPHQSKLKYTQLFNTNDRNKRGHLTGVEARALLVQLGLPQPILAQIWTLSDIDKDGKLTCDEFCIAMFLCDVAKSGVPLPAVLPPELMPGKPRSGSFGPTNPPQPPASQNDSFGDLLGGMGMAPPPLQPLATNGETQQEEDDKTLSMVTFEDRRKENFAKGQAELDRRRQMLQDQMKRENAARMEKERQEQEKRERIRQEQERKRLLEMERQMEKQRQVEREREEQRQKMLEQREAARRELDRQRQMEWERQRKEQLLGEKGREYEQLGAVKSRASNLRCELDSLQGKKTEIDQKIIQVRQGVTDFTTNIEAMRIIRDGKINDIDKIEKDIKGLSEKLMQVQTERESLDYRVQTTSQSNPLSEPHRTVLHAVELKKTAIQKLKKELEDIERDTESNLLGIDNCNAEHIDLNSKLSNLQKDLTNLQRQQNQKQTEAMQQKRRMEEEALNKQKQEREKQEKLRKELEAQRLKEQEEQNKKEDKPQDDAWFAFGNDNKPATTASNDIWSSAFASAQSLSKNNDTWASAFSSQTTSTQAGQSSVNKKGKNFKALYPFEARNPDELNLNPGDIVWIPDDQSGADEGWMSGELNGKKGWFPKDYVETIPETESSQTTNDAFRDVISSEQSMPSNFGQFDGTDESPFGSSSLAVSPTPGQGQTAPDGLQAQVLYPWKAKKDNHLSFNKGDIINVKEQQDLWWFGELNGQEGWFPKSYVKLVSGPATTSSSKQSSRSGTPLTNPLATGSSRSTPVVIEPTPEVTEQPIEQEAYVALFSYTSSEVGDLNFNHGDIILVSKSEGDWWTGSLGDKTGIFPANYVKKSDQSDVIGSVEPANVLPPGSADMGVGNPLTSAPDTSNPFPTAQKLDPFANITFDQTDGLSGGNEKSNFEQKNIDIIPDSVGMGTAFDKSPFDEQFSVSSGFTGDPFAAESNFDSSFAVFSEINNISTSSTHVTTGSTDLASSVSLTSIIKSDGLTTSIGSSGLSTSILQTSISSSSQSSKTIPTLAVDTKSMLESVTTSKIDTQMSMSETESFLELSQYFPSSPLSSTAENIPQTSIPVEVCTMVAVTSSSDSLLSNTSPVVTFDLGSSSVTNSLNTSDPKGDNLNIFGTSNNDPFANWNPSIEKEISSESKPMSSTQSIPVSSVAAGSLTDGPQNDDLFNTFVKTSPAPTTTESKTTIESVVDQSQTLYHNSFVKSSPVPKTAESNTGSESTAPKDSANQNKVYDNLFGNFNFVQTLSKSSAVLSKVTESGAGNESPVVSDSANENQDYDDAFSNFDFVKTLSKTIPMPETVKPTTESKYTEIKNESFDVKSNFDTTFSKDPSQISSELKPAESSVGMVSSSGAQSVIEEPEYDDLFNNFNDTKTEVTDKTNVDSETDENIYEYVSPIPILQSAEQGSTTHRQPAVQSQQPTIQPVQPSQTTLSANVQQPQQNASTSSTLKKPEIASVIAAYTATGPEQLSLQPGQIIQVRKKSPSGWWEGELQARGQKRKIGWFPANYVKLLGSSARSTPDSSSQRNSPANTLSRSATPSMPPPQPQTIQTESKYVDQVIALYPYVPQHDDELTFHKDSVINVINKDDANWWKGEVNGVCGVFPSNYVGPLTVSPPQENTWSSDPDVLAQTSAIESKRQNYIHELINTEETYMSDMSIVLDAFHKPMSEAKVMTEEELSTVFVNWTELILCNTKLSKSLRVRKKMCGKGQVIQIIGDILCENLPHMTAYIRFCSCQLNAAALIQRKTETSSEFKEIQKKCVQDSRTKGMPLSSFLLKPMQRITKYPLMIQKILQYTPECHPDHQNLQDALAKAEELCNQVNEGVRERENCDKLEWIQSRVQCDGLGEKIIFNSITNCLGPRKLLYSSTLYKVKSNKELVAFLFNDFLLLTIPLSSSASTFMFDPKAKAQYKMYKNPIFLNEIMVKKVGEEDNEPYIFHVSHVDRVYNLKASNQTERDSWVRHIGNASKLFLDTEKKKRENAYISVSKSQHVGRLLVIIAEGINLASTEDVKKIPGVGRLLVVLLEGCDLIASDANGKSDPYCEVSMGVQEHKTKVINATLNPKWNASMQFTIKDVEQDVLCITVFDRDLFSPNDFLGRTEVRVKDILNESKQKKGPITKRLLLHEVSKGEVVVKLDLQLYDST